MTSMIQSGRFDLRLPSTISGLKLWLKADGTKWQDSARTTPAVADTDPVGCWDDASGTGNHLAQATSNKRPLLRSSVVNGLPVIRFDGSNDTLLTTTASGLDAASFTQFCVVKKSATGNMDIFGAGSAASSGNTELYTLSEKLTLAQENLTTAVTGATTQGTTLFKIMANQHINLLPDLPTYVANTTTYDAFGVVMPLANGSLLYVYRQGASHVGSGDYGVIRTCLSTDDGATWSAATTIFTETNVDLRNVGGGVTADGRVVIFFGRLYPTGLVWLSNVSSYSDDNGATWSTPTTLSQSGFTLTGFSPHGKMIQTDDGQLLMSWYGNNATTAYCFATKSSDNGVTWSAPILVISGLMAGGSNSIFSEWCACPIGGGVVIGLCRADNGTSFTQVISHDNGATWSSQGLTSFDTWLNSSPNTSPWLERVGPRLYVFYGQRTAQSFRVASASRCGLVSGPSGWGNRVSMFSPGVTDMGYASTAVTATGRIVGVSYWGKSASDADLYAWSWPAPATMFHQGTVDGIGAARKVFNTGTRAWMGSERDLAQYWNGDIAEFIYYNRALSIEEINRVGLYLAGKYALTWNQL